MKPLQKKDFGMTSKGAQATLYILENEAGMQISVSDFGATLTSVLVPDKDNNPVEVTLGYDDAAGYEAGLGNAFGASVGRNANRIAGAVIEINGTEYHLTKNDGENNLHSGLDFYHGRLWKVADADDTHVTFEMDSPERMKRFLDDINSPNVEAILDPVNLISGKNYKNQEGVLEQAFALYGDRISMVHIKDFRMENGEPQFEHIGDGLFHYEPLLRWLKKEKPYITMLLENSNRERCHRDVAYLQKIYEEV